ncbi:MAG: nucleoside deaminase [Myxococcales bacterium]|nr:nucleoside deaminase [Myxococcales bacterium]
MELITSTLDENDHRLLRRAIDLATENVTAGGGGPFGCVVARDGVILAEGKNRVVEDNDPTAHAEIVAIRTACSRLGHFQLEGAVIYSSTLPCPMCLSAILWARPAAIVYGASAEDAAAVGFDDAAFYAELSRDPSERKLPVLQALHAEALEPLRAWAKSPTRVEY